MTQPTPILAVVLCGGLSTRMGTDKGLLKRDGTPWVHIMQQLFTKAQLPSVISIHEAQQDDYLQQGIQDTIIDNPNLTVKGPLKGILSVHEQFTKHSLFVAACDMVNMQTQPMQYLLNLYQQNGALYDAFVFGTQEQCEPLMAIYCNHGLHTVQASFANGTFNRFSLQWVLAQINTCFVPLPNEWQHLFRNFNHPNDLTGNV